MYAALDLHEKSIQCVVKDSDGRVVKESKVGKDEGEILRFLEGTHASVVMESGYNHQFIRDLLMEKGYAVKVAHPLMVKAIAYAKVKSDKVDARTLADLLRTDMIPEAYVPDPKTRDLRDLVRRRHYLVQTRSTFKSKVHVEIAKRWIKKHQGGDLFTESGRSFLRSLHIDAVDDYLDTIGFLDDKIRELDRKVKALAEGDRYARLLVTIPGVSFYSALLISGEIADVDRFPDHEHLCSYAGLAPAVHQSADRSHTTPSRMRNANLSWIMIQCIHVHVRRCKDSSITRFYTELAKRRGEKIAIVAAARKLMRAMYVMLKEEQPFRLDG